MVKVNLKVVVDVTPMLVVSRTQVDHMDMEGDRHLNSTMMILELDPFRLPSVHTAFTLNSKWVKAQQLAGQRMIPVKPILVYPIHQVVHHRTPIQTPMQVDRHLHHTSPPALVHLPPDLLLRPIRIRTGQGTWARPNQLLIRYSSLSPHLSQHRNCAT
jgi:hypothetical protein